MKTIIAEKPSVAREIARIVGAAKREEGYFEGGGYAVTWAFGHLVQLAMPDGYGIRGFVRDNLPVIHDSFTLIPRQVKAEKGYKPDSGVVAQIKTITRLFNDSEQIIVATDAGREGELIFRYLYHYIGCATPFVRLWISSLTDKAIRDGLRNLEAGSKYDNLYLAAKARSESDWLVGINGTQALSIAAGHGTYSVGRVQTPTLAMVCARYWENRRFTPEAFWQLHIATDGCDEGTVKFSSSEKWKEKESATELYNKVKSAGTATVTKAERKEKTEETPLLYDLTTLQKEANAKHGFTAEQTLEIAQKLYEKKLITYPRTGSRYIPEDVFAEIPKLLAFTGSLPEWKGKLQPKAVPTRRSLDGGKVTDHHARDEQGMVVRHLAAVHAAACRGGFRPHLVFPFGLRADEGEQLGDFSEHVFGNVAVSRSRIGYKFLLVEFLRSFKRLFRREAVLGVGFFLERRQIIQKRSFLRLLLAFGFRYRCGACRLYLIIQLHSRLFLFPFLGR